MRTIFVDDEKWMLQQFENECSGIPDIELIGSFTNPEKALEFSKSKRVDLAFLDIEMPGMSGLTLSDELRKVHPGIIIIFISAYDKYMREAFRDHEADYFIVKPYRQKDILSVIQRAKALSVRLRKRVYIETFGQFNIYVDGQAVKIRSDVAREIMALLVSKRGTTLGNKEAFLTMWENKPYSHDQAKSYYKALKKLKDALCAAGIGDILVHAEIGYRLDTTKFDCDYYQLLDGDPDAVKKYQGIFLPEFFWAEETTALLTERCAEK